MSNRIQVGAVSLAVLAVAGCGGSSDGGLTVDGPSETLRASFELPAEQYADADAGSDCESESADTAMFQAGAPVVASNTDEPTQTVFIGSGKLGSGFVSRGGGLGENEEVSCRFEAEFQLLLGPESYELIVGLEQEEDFTVRFSQQDVANVGTGGEYDNASVGVYLSLE